MVLTDHAEAYLPEIRGPQQIDGLRSLTQAHCVQDLSSSRPFFAAFSASFS